MKRRYNVFVTLLFFMVFTLAGCGDNNAAAGTVDPVADTVDPVAGAVDSVEETTDTTEETKEDSGESRTLKIIHVNDVHGYIEESDTAIGYAKLAALIGQMKEEDPNTIALDAGDTFAGSPNASFDKGESIVPILNTVGFDAMVLGNHESYLGLDQITTLTGRIHYTVLAGNVVTTDGKKLWDSYTIITLENGLNVGIVTATCGDAAGLEFLDPIESLQSQVDKIKTEVDVVVALVHLGVEDSSGNTSQLVAAEVEGVDVIIDGHSHTVLEKGMIVNGVLIAQTGEYGGNIGITELRVTSGAVESVTSHLITKEEMLEAEVKEDTLAAVEELLVKSEVYYAQVIGETRVDLIGTRELIRVGETNIGSLYADAIKDATGAEIALCGAGGIGGEIPIGEITKRDVLSISIVVESYFVGEMKGSDIVDALNNHVSNYPEASGAFFQVSGISFKIDPDQPVGERVHSIHVGDEVIDLQQTYTVAFSELAKSGVSFSNAVIISNDLPKSDVIIENYIIENSPISPEVEGRIIIEAISP